MERIEIPIPPDVEKEREKWAFENLSRRTTFEVSRLEIPDLTIPRGKDMVKKNNDVQN